MHRQIYILMVIKWSQVFRPGKGQLIRNSSWWIQSVQIQRSCQGWERKLIPKSMWPCFSRGVEPDDLQRSLLTSAALWMSRGTSLCGITLVFSCHWGKSSKHITPAISLMLFLVGVSCLCADLAVRGSAWLLFEWLTPVLRGPVAAAAMLHLQFWAWPHWGGVTAPNPLSISESWGFIATLSVLLGEDCLAFWELTWILEWWIR